MYKIQQFILCRTFLSSKFIYAVYVGTVPVTFLDTIIDALSVFVFVVFVISLHVISELSIAIAKYSPFSQLHLARFQI